MFFPPMMSIEKNPFYYTIFIVIRQYIYAYKIHPKSDNFFKYNCYFLQYTCPVSSFFARKNTAPASLTVHSADTRKSVRCNIPQAHRRSAFLFTALSMPQNYAHHISPAFSKMRTSFKKVIAFSRPSLGDISPSSCSMEITPS